MGPDNAVRRSTVPVETAANICGCTPEEVRRLRKQVLPRPPGFVDDVEMFQASEVVSMAAGVVAKTWRVKADLDQLVARLALKSIGDRDWVLVYESRKGLRIEPKPFTFAVGGAKRGAVFDPAPYYEAFDAAMTA
jgi:hypothetical protein